MIKSFCNPLPLPDYAKGVVCDVEFSPLEWQKHYRETADPSVIYDDGTWYMYASGHLVYKSTDFVTWEYIPIPVKMGYAPSAVKHKGKYLLTASAYRSPNGTTDLFVSDFPVGPFERLGAFRDKDGNEVAVCDPMLFSDEDGSLYLYYGGGNDGIYGVRLSDEDFCCFAGEIHNLIRYDSEHVWERFGGYHENDRVSWIEGGWMYKKNGVYYLVYCAPGTVYSSYALGAYKGKSALGPFEYQKNNPFLTNEIYGRVIRGCGHGSVVDGPNDSIWAFYTATICLNHPFERIVGMDRLFIDENGDLASYGTTEIPQTSPLVPHSDLGWLPLTVRSPIKATSELPGREAICATEEDLICRWVPDPEDPSPSVTVDFRREFTVCAARVIFSDEGLNYHEGCVPYPRRYTIEGHNVQTQAWEVLVDRSENTVEMMIDYHAFEHQISVDAVRLTLIPDPNATVGTGVRNFAVFGMSDSVCTK